MDLFLKTKLKLKKLIHKISIVIREKIQIEIQKKMQIENWNQIFKRSDLKYVW